MLGTFVGNCYDCAGLTYECEQYAAGVGAVIEVDGIRHHTAELGNRGVLGELVNQQGHFGAFNYDEDSGRC